MGHTEGQADHTYAQQPMRKLMTAFGGNKLNGMARQHAQMIAALGEQLRVRQPAALAQARERGRVVPIELIHRDNVVRTIGEKFDDAANAAAATIQNIPVQQPPLYATAVHGTVRCNSMLICHVR